MPDRLYEQEMLNLIFEPGFSTASEITEVSGRGVGMDVVRTVLDRLKGTVHVASAKERAPRTAAYALDARQHSDSLIPCRWPFVCRAAFIGYRNHSH